MKSKLIGGVLVSFVIGALVGIVIAVLADESLNQIDLTVADESWDAQHTGLVTGIKTLHLTNNDMPQTWSSANKAIFTCTVSVNDGKTTRIVDNQIIS